MNHRDFELTMKEWSNLSESGKMDIIIRNSIHLDIFADEHEALRKNLHLVDRFLKEAHKVSWVRKHYSVRTIFEVLRHNTILEQKDSEFKISNDLIIPMGRVSMLFPRLNGLFSFKERKR